MLMQRLRATWAVLLLEQIRVSLSNHNDRLHRVEYTNFMLACQIALHARQHCKRLDASLR